MPENDTIPTVENMLTEKAGWLYFCPWYGEHILDSSKNDPDTLKSIYQNDYCINLADLPVNLYTYQSQKDTDGDDDSSEVTTSTTTEPVIGDSENTVTTTEDITTEEVTTTTSADAETTTSPIETTTETTTTSGGTTSSTQTGDSLLGDVNLDGSIRVSDIQLIRQWLLHSVATPESTDQAFINADVTTDGNIRVNDIQRIRQYVLHIIDSLE
jgi:mannan endo-1,4-beta-mannosidase